MKNKNLISKLRNLKKLESLENVEGSMLQSIKGGEKGFEVCNAKQKTPEDDLIRRRPI